MKRIITVIVGVYAFAMTTAAFAYVDPGTGSMAIQFLIGGLVAAAFMLRTYYYSLKNRVKRLFGRAPTEEAATADSGSSIASREQSPPGSK